MTVNEYFSFKVGFAPCTSYIERNKISGHLMIILASEEGLIQIYSLQEEKKGDLIWSTNISSNFSQNGAITKVLYHQDSGLMVTTFKGLL